MKKYDGENGETVFGSVDVYLASDADARIAELEEFIKVLLPSWPDGEHYPTEMSLLQMKQERIAELEKALRAWTGGEHAQWCGTVRNSVDPCDCGYGLIENSTL